MFPKIRGFNTELRSKKHAAKNTSALKAMKGQSIKTSSPNAFETNDRFTKIPYWYAVNSPPPTSADPEGYMKLIPKGQPYMCYANVLGIKPWVVSLLKKVLRWRYFDHERLLDINLRRQDDKDRLTEEINITFRNYATELNQLLRKGQILPERLQGKMRHYEVMEELSTRVEKIASYRVSGYLLYKVAEGLMKEIIQERRAYDRQIYADLIRGINPKQLKKGGWQGAAAREKTKQKYISTKKIVRKLKKSLVVKLKISPEKLEPFLENRPSGIRLRLKCGPESMEEAKSTKSL